ncbi:hypothetical protein [Nocardiopsis lambiniae]|uniref:Lipoprotein n=1 Tax=Nocardiopsis lambiniae TaxID=3075539 RepID=A0ABU2MBU0_9ACTN|nr:hypothetical protein [Nocardiopsis sp. DSM 44743]MDT0330027.1 hypothetical protein [Nocardiopsis sp. DSM 44743]
MPLTPRAVLCAALVAASTLTACAPAENLLNDVVRDVTGVPITYDEVDRDDPFGGTEAEGYDEEFVVPEAAGIGEYPADRIQEAYDVTGAFLDAVYLDRTSVFEGDDMRFRSLLAGQARDWYQENAGHEDPALDTRSLLFHLTPGTAEPIGDVVKVKGRMWAETAQDETGWDYLAVRTEYTIVHPVARPGEKVSVRLVTSHYGEVSFYDLGDGRWEAWPNWWRSAGPAHCLWDEYTFTPAYPDEMPEGERPKGWIEGDPYDLEAARDMDEQECGAIGAT